MQTNSLPTAQETNSLVEALITKGIEFGIGAVSALVILVVGLIVASWIKGGVKSALTKSGKVDKILIGFLSSIVYYLILAVVVIMVLGRFGIQTTSLAALLGAAGLAIGLSLQGTLGHVASGVMLLLFRPFKIGDFVEVAGVAGSVSNLTIFTTEMTTPDNKKIIIPNGSVWDNTITNYSANPTRRLDMVFGISYDDDIGKARDIILNLLKADPRVHSDPEPLVEVVTLNDFSVDFTARVWLAGGDYFAVKFDMNRKVKEAFDKEGISIPFPTALHYNKND